MDPLDQQLDQQLVRQPLDLDGIEADLADVESALARLDAGTYWTDEVTGAQLTDEEMTVHPLARRSPSTHPDV